MRSKNLMILAVIVVAIGAFIFFVERHRPTTDEQLAKADRVFPKLDEDEIVSVELRTGDGPIRLAKDGDDWRLVEPVDYPADAAAVRSLVRSLAALDVDRKLAGDEVEPADFGLDDPSLAAVLESSDGTRFSLDIGDETPLGGKRAVRRGGGGEILFCSDSFVRNLDRKVDEWRSRDVVDVLEGDLRSVEIETASDRIRVERIGDRWQLVEPLSDLADGEQMRSLISDLNALRISEFLPPDADASELGLDAPEYRVVLTRADDGNPVTLELAAPGGDKASIVVRRNGGELFRIAAGGIRARLAKAPVLWRSAKVWPFSSWDVGKVEFEASGQEVDLDESDGLWQLSDGGEADNGNVRRRLNALADLEVRDHDLLLPPTEVAGSVILVLDADGGAEGVTFTFYRPIEEGGHAVVTVSTRRDVMGIDAAVVDTIIGDLDALHPPADEPVGEESGSEPE